MPVVPTAMRKTSDVPLQVPKDPRVESVLEF